MVPRSRIIGTAEGCCVDNRWLSTDREGQWLIFGQKYLIEFETSVVLEKSNMETLAASLYLSVHSLRQEDYDDRDAASAGEIYAILVSKSTVYVVQSSQ